MLPPTYPELLKSLKVRIAQERTRIVLAANTSMIFLYWEIGHEILRRQAEEGYGTRVIDRLSADLRHAFPEMRGLSSRNLKYMRTFAAAWPDHEVVQRVVAQLPWGHNVVFLDDGHWIMGAGRWAMEARYRWSMADIEGSSSISMTHLLHPSTINHQPSSIDHHPSTIIQHPASFSPTRHPAIHIKL